MRSTWKGHREPRRARKGNRREAERFRGWPALYRTLGRRPEARLLETSDLKHLWVAYRLGGFPNVPAGLTASEFKAASEAQLLSYDLALLLLAYSGGAQRPVGLILGYLSGHRMEPHAVWFPWATARNRLEAIVHFINEFRRDYLILVYAWGPNQRFFLHLGKYGILKQIAPIPNWYGPKEDAMLFISKGFRPELSKPE